MFMITNMFVPYGTYLRANINLLIIVVKTNLHKMNGIWCIEVHLGLSHVPFWSVISGSVSVAPSFSH